MKENLDVNMKKFDYRTLQILKCGFLYCHEQQTESYAELFYRFLEENIEKLDENALTYMYVYTINQTQTWQEIKTILKKEIDELLNEFQKDFYYGMFDN